MLCSIARDSTITQRKLAGRLGIGVGLANAYLRRCARTGFVKIVRVPLNRYAYYPTPRGCAEKSRATVVYPAASFEFFRRARRDCAAIVMGCAARGWRRVALCRAGDLAEVAVPSVGGTTVEVLCVIDNAAGQRLAALPDVNDVAAALLLAGCAGRASRERVRRCMLPHARFVPGLREMPA